MASLDIKTAFHEARPRHIARIMESHNTHRWLIAAHFREMSGLEGKAMFECVERSFNFNRCLRQGFVEAPRLWQMMAAQLLVSVEGTWGQKNMVSCWTSKERRCIRSALCGPTTSGSCPTPRCFQDRFMGQMDARRQRACSAVMSSCLPQEQGCALWQVLSCFLLRQVRAA